MATDLPLSFYVMIGAVAAALITAFFNITSVLVSKEQEVSNFRQSWLDNFRLDISCYLGLVQALLRIAEHQIPKDRPGLNDSELKTFRESNKSTYEKLNEMYYRVVLRLNPEEHRELYVQIVELHGRFYGDCSNLKALHQMQENVTAQAQKVIKGVWERVKKGEPYFARLRTFLFIGIMAGLIALGALVYHSLQK